MTNWDTGRVCVHECGAYIPVFVYKTKRDVTIVDNLWGRLMSMVLSVWLCGILSYLGVRALLYEWRRVWLSGFWIGVKFVCPDLWCLILLTSH